MTRTRRRWRAASMALAAAAMLAVSGCMSIAGAGTVQTGLKDLERVEQSPVQYNADGPVPGASQEDIARAFVVAAISPIDDYAVAREFLEPDYADQWDPTFGVLIDDGRRQYSADGDAAGVLSVGAVAKVDGDGALLPVEPGPETELRFEFTQVGGEWRIASAPSGIILDSTKFQEIWTAQQLYFVGPANTLVPETRWYVSRSALATELVTDLLQGPGERLRDAVHSGFPTGTALVSNSVPIVEGRARVDLTSEVLEAGAEALAEIRQQLATTLQSVTGVNGVDLYVDGTALRDNGSDAGTPAALIEIANPAVLREGAFGTLVQGEFAPMSGFFATLDEYAPDAITLAPNETGVAVRGDDGVSLVDAENSVQIDARDGLLPPVFDRLGFIWTAPRTHPEAIQVTDRAGTVSSVAAPWLESRRPVTIRVSPDGARLALLLATEDGSQVLVAGIVRDAAGRPTGLTQEVDAAVWADGAPLDLDWVGQRALAVLTDSGTTSKVTYAGLGQFPTDLGAVQGGVQVAGGGARTQMRVLASDGTLYASQSSGWQRAGADVDVLAKRG